MSFDLVDMCLHLSVRGGNDNNSTVHRGSTGNHVLNVIGVTGTVDVGIMSVIGLVLDVGGRNGDTTLALFRSLVDSTVFEELGVSLLSLTLRDSRGQGSLFQMSILQF